MTKNPYDPEDFMKAFDPEAMKRMFDPQNFLSALLQGTESFDMSNLMERNKEQIDAMVEANRAVLETYQDMVAKQKEIFKEVIAPAQAKLAEVSDPAKIKDQTDTVNQAIADGFALMKTLAENAQKANEDAIAGFKAELDKALK